MYQPTLSQQSVMPAQVRSDKQWDHRKLIPSYEECLQTPVHVLYKTPDTDRQFLIKANVPQLLDWKTSGKIGKYVNGFPIGYEKQIHYSSDGYCLWMCFLIFVFNVSTLAQYFHCFICVFLFVYCLISLFISLISIFHFLTVFLAELVVVFLLILWSVKV